MVQQHRGAGRLRLGLSARGKDAHGGASINDAWGVRPKAAPGGRDGQAWRIEVRGIDAGEPGGGEPPRRVSGGRCARSRRQSCAARCRRLGRRCPHWCGHDCTARCGAKCGSAPQERAHERRHRCAGWCTAQCASRWTAKPTPARHEVPPAEPRRCPHRDERGAQRRREEDAAVRGTMRSKRAPCVPLGSGGERSEPPGKRSAQ